MRSEGVPVAGGQLQGVLAVPVDVLDDALLEALAVVIQRVVQVKKHALYIHNYVVRCTPLEPSQLVNRKAHSSQVEVALLACQRNTPNQYCN